VGLPPEFVEACVPVLVVEGDLLLEEPLSDLVRRLVSDDREQGQARLRQPFRIVDDMRLRRRAVRDGEGARSSSRRASSTASGSSRSGSFVTPGVYDRHRLDRRRADAEVFEWLR
jgi:hypothetical protein